MKKINFAFGLHNHQPVGNFDFVFEHAYEKAYLPFLELLEKHPKVRIAQHYTGILLEWIKENKPDFLPRLRKLVESGQIEMMTGGYYEPILSVIPDEDKIGQIEKLSTFVKRETGYDPIGMWMAERIWEPHLPKPCAEAGAKYVVLDDSHFKNAGLKGKELHGYYITEEQGSQIFLFPIAEELRYTIPFQPPEKTIEFFRSIATEEGDTLVVFADDGEKFGVWPDTYEHCYKKGWLEEFFSALEENSDWINLLHPSEALAKLRPLGRIYLPTASYREMMEWAMPTGRIHEYEQFESTLKEQEIYDKYKVFVRGGFWRNFLAKYPESNNMHKKMLHLRNRLKNLSEKFDGNKKYQQALDYIWAGQCNCPYWHGVFGGLYLNHLRYATYHRFLLAETLIDDLERNGEDWMAHQKTDFDEDGSDELLISNEKVNLYFSPENGGGLFELDYKPKAINLLDTMTRREESYHQKLLELKHSSESGKQNSGEEGIASIHDRVIMKEEGLENLLFYDRYRRTALLDHFLDDGDTLQAFSQSDYHEAGDFVDGEYDYEVEEGESGLTVSLRREGVVYYGDRHIPVSVGKRVRLVPNSSEIVIDYQVVNLSEQEEAFRFGVEFDFALLAGDAPDRNYIFPGHDIDDTRLRSTGEVENVNDIRLKDEWLRILVSLQSENPATVWRFPIETVSQSEGGFERVYQSSVVFPNWKFRLAANGEWRNRFTLKIDEIEKAE